MKRGLKLRVAASGADGARRVKEPSPMKRGLKFGLDFPSNPLGAVKEPSPMKRGLKLVTYVTAASGGTSSEGTFPDEEGTEISDRQQTRCRISTVKEPSPMKRGLKWRPGDAQSAAIHPREGTFPDEEGTEI